MANKKRKIIVMFDCEHLDESKILGKITDELLSGGIAEFFKLCFADVEMHPEEGDFYTIKNPVVITTQAQLDTVCLVHPDEMLPTDDESILADFSRDGTHPKFLQYEKRCRELENDGCTRSDAQGIASAEGLDPDQAMLDARSGRESTPCPRNEMGVSKIG